MKNIDRDIDAALLQRVLAESKFVHTTNAEQQTSLATYFSPLADVWRQGVSKDTKS